MTGFVEIEVWPIHVTSSGQRYKVTHAGEILIESAREGFFEGARAIMELGGAEADDIIISRDGPTGMQSLSARIGWAATRTVAENQQHGPHTTKWEPRLINISSDESD